MKLKTKFQDEDFELGEVVDATISTKAKAKQGGEHLFNFSRISELFELFEDYEEPKEYYAIDLQSDIIRWARHSWGEKTTNKIKEIGNYFETKEEAEKAVEKLKAWKRLKDKGFRFNGKEVFSEGLIKIDGVLPALEGADNAKRLKIIDDLDLLFGGEE